MERCPNCRASYKGGQECRRCGMKLGGLLAIEAQARAREWIAIQQIAADNLAGAEQTLIQTLRLYASPLAERLLGFVRAAAVGADNAATADQLPRGRFPPRPPLPSAAMPTAPATLPALAKLPWHPSNDFTPIASIYSSMFVMPTNSANAAKLTERRCGAGRRFGGCRARAMGLE